jgi:hypothetical protein
MEDPLVPKPIALSVLLTTPFFLPARAPALPAASCPDEIPHQPVLVYEVTGLTSTGFVDLELVLYQDGESRLSSANAAGDGKARLAYVPSYAAAGLLADLSAAGAFQLCDQIGTLNDAPLSTLTVMRPQTDARAHTFTWFDRSVGGYGPVEQRLESFLETAFPGF